MDRSLDIHQLEQPLVFVHIPKTAGTAFTNYLTENMPSRECISPAFIESYDAIQWNDPVLRLFWGHFPFRLVSERVKRAHFLTFLRNPIERAISQYRSWNNVRNLGPGDPWRLAMTPEQIGDIEFVQSASLEEFVMCNRPNLIAGINDLQTAMLSSTDDRSSPSFLGTAQENLDRMSYFGIVERFSESIELFRATFGNAKRYKVPAVKENRSHSVPLQLSNDAKARLYELNKNDVALYDYAARIFDNRYAARAEIHGH